MLTCTCSITYHLNVVNNFPNNGFYATPTRAETEADDKQQRRIRYHRMLFIECAVPLTPDESAELSAISVEFNGEPVEGALSDSEYDFMRVARQKAAA